MPFEATKREWSELYAFFHLLANGKINDKPIAVIQRTEHDGLRKYYIEKENICIEGEKINKKILREDIQTVAELILSAIKSSSDDVVVSPDGVEEFLDELAIYNLEAQTEDRTDLSIAFWHPEAPLIGFSIYSRLSKMRSLLDGGRTANLKFELTGVKFAVPTVNKVNALDSPNEVPDRMMLIERLGGILKYADVADRVFRCNLLMIDLHFPRLLAEMLRIMQLDGIMRINELTETMKTINPLKIKEELINKHGFYEFKMKQFLMALALGMRPAKIYNGTDSAIEGIILIHGNGELDCYHKSDKKEFEDFLFHNTRFEKGAIEKDKYGYLERENGIWYFKLNAKIGLSKR
ncbi:HpaII family restriction endonuclease [Bacteroides sp. 224]|uniref:HpaII family restriction endonuclease n=1 Tax=Bacteroides sp. 224 TaxID=2302936 RepID=UPI0013D01DA4|nr:HpaII family restriction endonuclease [Bacteroides sp. 224]NDV64399.1 HpaII family restriction endonuclease [Bacteroides sp. 224]